MKYAIFKEIIHFFIFLLFIAFLYDKYTMGDSNMLMPIKSKVNNKLSTKEFVNELSYLNSFKKKNTENVKRPKRNI